MCATHVAGGRMVTAQVIQGKDALRNVALGELISTTAHTVLPHLLTLVGYFSVVLALKDLLARTVAALGAQYIPDRTLAIASLRSGTIPLSVGSGQHTI